MNRREFLTATGALTTTAVVPAAATGDSAPTVSYPRLSVLEETPAWTVNGTWRTQTTIEKYGYTVLEANAASVLYEQTQLRDHVATLTDGSVDRIIAPVLATRIDFDSYVNFFLNADTVADQITDEFEAALVDKEFTNLQQTKSAAAVPTAEVVREYTAEVPVSDNATVTVDAPTAVREAVATGRIPVRIVAGIWKPTTGTAYLGAFGYPDIDMGPTTRTPEQLRTQLVTYVNQLGHQ